MIEGVTTYSEAEIAQYWEGQADRWSNGRHFLHTEYHRQKETINKALAIYHRQMSDSPGLILDLGSGGSPDVYLGEDLMPQVVAVDLSFKALTASPARLKIQRDIRLALPFSNKTFAWATMFFLNRYLDDQKAVMKEVYRVLKPGGKFIALDFTCNNMLPEVSRFDPALLSEELVLIGFGHLHHRELLPGIYFPDDDFSRGPLYLLTGKKPR